MVVLATQTPATRVLNGPQPKRACVIIPSGCCRGAGVSACAEETRAKPATVTAINLNICPTFGFVGPFQELGNGAPVSLSGNILWGLRFILTPPREAHAAQRVNFDLVVARGVVFELDGECLGQTRV